MELGISSQRVSQAQAQALFNLERDPVVQKLRRNLFSNAYRPAVSLHDDRRACQSTLHCTPMSQDLRTRLLAAANAGEIVSIVYHRGSQPGAVRDIAPIAVTDEEVRARDLVAGTDKRFKLAHLELAGPQTTARAYDHAPPPPVEDTQTLRAALGPHVAALQALGWHVELTDTSVSLLRYFKNGKLRKGADVAILFKEFLIDAWDDRNGWREEAVTSTRPYYVASPSFDRARTFARLSMALALFLEEARKLAPGS